MGWHIHIKRAVFFFWLITTGVAIAGQQASEDVAGVLEILTPHAHNPTFVEPGGQFRIEVSAQPGLSNVGWTVTLKNDLTTWPCEVDHVASGTVFNGTEQGWILTVQTPARISPELMALTLTHDSGEAGISDRAVSVVPDFEQSFYIFHQSDQHLTQETAVEPGGKASTKWGNGSMEALTWLAPIVNLVNPRFVLHTGDNMQIYHEPDSWCGLEEGIRRIDRFINGFSDYRVPTVATTGNHDIGYTSYVDIERWRDAYRRYMGQRAFSFRMGSFYVLASEWTDTAFTGWARDDFRRSWEDPGVRYRLIATHFYDGLQGNTTIANENYPCDLTLVGHIHRTRIVQQEPYQVLAVGAAQEYQRAAFFNFRRTNAGWERAQPDIHADGINVHRLVGDYGEPTVSITFENENDGSASSNTAIITNKLPHNFYDGRVRFLMEKGDYQITGGEILANYNFSDNKKTAILVKVNLAESAATRVSIFKD